MRNLLQTLKARIVEVTGYDSTPKVSCLPDDSAWWWIGKGSFLFSYKKDFYASLQIGRFFYERLGDFSFARCGRKELFSRDSKRRFAND